MPRAKEAFAKIALRYLSNPKIAPLLDESHAAVTLHLASILYACEQRTDGLVPVKPLLRQANATEGDAKLLLDAGLWEDAEDGRVQIHDFLDWQTSNAFREAMSANGKRGGRPPKGEGKPKGFPNGSPKGGEKREVRSKKLEVLSLPAATSASGRAPLLGPNDKNLAWIHGEIEGGLDEDEQLQVMGMFAEKGYDGAHVLNIIRKQRRDRAAAAFDDHPFMED